MPQVPVVNQNSVRLDPLPRQRLQAADFGSAGEQVGRAVQGFGQDLRQFVEKQDDINLRYDTAAVKDADAKVQADLAPIRASVLNAQGMDAVGAKANAVKALGELRTKYAGTLATPRQKQMFEDAFQRFDTSERSTYDEHEAKQVRVAETAASNARLDASMDRAVDLRSNPEASQAALADAIQEMKAVNRGAAPEMLQRKGQELLSSYHVRVADAMRDDDPLGALDYVNKNADTILPDDEVKFRRQIKGEVEEAEDDASLGMVFEEVGQRRGGPTEDDHKAGEEVGKANGWPLRGYKGVSSGFGDTRDGGKRQHAADDIPAPAGTPVYAPMQGKVEKVWYDPKGGNSILVRHPDGRVTGYAHLRNVNVQAGETVDQDTVLGGVGNTGSGSRGNHLHYTVRNAEGNRVDPSKQRWNAGDIPAYTSERQDKQALYDAVRRVAVRENWSAKRTDRAYAKVDQHVARNDNLKARAEEDAQDQVGAILDKLGDGFTDILQIPKNVRDRLAPGKLNAYREAAKQNLTGDHVKPGGDDYLGLLELSGNPQTQDDFARADLSGYASKMSRGEYTSLRKAQIDIRNGGRKNPTAVEFGRIDTMVQRYIPQSGGLLFDPKAKPTEQQAVRWRRAQVVENVRTKVAAAQEKKGQALTDDELAGIVRSTMAPVFLNGDPATPIARGALPKGSNVAVSVPNADRDQIISAYRRRYGRAPTAGQVADIYLNAGGGLR